MNGFKCVRSGGLPAASEARSLVFRSPQPSACWRTLKLGNFFSNSAMLVSLMVLTVCGSTSVCQTCSSRVCWPIAAGAAPRPTAVAAPAPTRKCRRETPWVRAISAPPCASVGRSLPFTTPVVDSAGRRSTYRGEETTNAKDGAENYPVPVVRYPGRGGRELLHLDLPELEDPGC